MGSEDYYTHGQHLNYKSKGRKYGTFGYDFRFNEKILRGEEVDGKYSTDLFVNRAKVWE